MKRPMTVLAATFIMMAGLVAPSAMAATARQAAVKAPAAAASAHAARPDYQVATSGAICGLPVSQRSGGWSCQATRRAPVTVSPATGYCRADGSCWNRTNDFVSTYSTTIGYGYNGEYLGSVRLDFDFSLTGIKLTTNPVQAVFTEALQYATIDGVDMNGDVFNGAPGVSGGGHAIRGKLKWSPHFGEYVRPSYRWTYSTTDNTTWDHNAINEVQWTVAGTTGYYYAYARSICSHTTDKKIYRFDSASSVPGDAEKSGWVA